MGIYRDKVLPRIVNAACASGAADDIRRQVCERLSGEVVEIGFGSGLNVPFYPQTVTGVAAVEPADLGWELAADRVRASAVPVRRAALDAQALPFADDTFSAAVSTWTMCTIPDAGSALAELRRVLMPGGRLHFVEHGLAPDPGVQRWQHRFDPIQQWMCGGCHLDRDILAMLTDAGFEIDHADVFYEPGIPRPWGADSLGVAVSP